MSTIRSYFDAALKAGASDLHLVAEAKPMLRVNGELQELAQKELPAKELQSAIESILSPEQKERYQATHELDMSYEQDGTRFRVNVHQQEGNIGLAARIIPAVIPTPEELRFEPIMQELPNRLDGLVLVVGPTGHGKSTTLASMVNEINKTRKAHIVTIEDPVEFVFTPEQALVEQREIGEDTESFAAALKHVLRQDPDVILVGEMRDPETIATVLTAAETGHLVFSTLHTSTAAEAIERIVDVFDGSKQKQVLIQLGAVLRAVVAQQLVPAENGGRVAAREILVNNPAVSNLIKENNIGQIVSAIQTGAKEGMISMENSLKALHKEGIISKETLEHRSGRARNI